MTRKLKKRPDGLSYKEVFSLNDANDKGAAKAARSGDASSLETSDKKPLTLRTVRSEHNTIGPDRADEMPSEKANDTDTSEATSAAEGVPQVPKVAAEPEAGVSEPDKPAEKVSNRADQAAAEPTKRISESSRARKPKSVPTPSPDKTRLRGYLRFPALGVSPSFDAIHDTYGPKVATKHFLDSAVEEFVEAVRAGKGPTRSVRLDYPTMPEKTQATRHVPLDVVDHVREMIDPMGILAPGTFGTRVLELAMAWQMENEGKNS